MTTDKPQILLVDDSQEDALLLLEMLRDLYSVVVATGGKKAVSLCEQGKVSPKVILMDVSMPDMDGYETCQKIKEVMGFEDVEVIFVSAHDTLEEKRRGYEVGGSDYLTKPVNSDELSQKVRLAVERERARQEAAAQSQSAMDTAMTAIMDAGEQGSVIHFLRESFTVNSIEALINSIITTASNFGLSSVVQIRTPWKTITMSSNGEPPPLEVEMLTTLKSIGRIHQLGKRLILNFGDISQLIKNLPVENEAKVGRLRDHLALVLEGATSRTKALLAVDEMRNLMEETNESLAQIHARQTKQKRSNIKIMEEMMEEIQAGLFEYGLTEEQEKVLLAMVEKYSDKIFQAYEEGMLADDGLENISTTLARSVERFFTSPE